MNLLKKDLFHIFRLHFEETIMEICTENSKEDPSIYEKDSTMYICEFCDKLLKTKFALYLHINNIHKTSVQLLSKKL